mmetsp:Transcript_38746/g.102479  ORF Transcript_38746/g.102479 Transcript_38746/m.102479 type:complete len:213 (-) Transcript_38746:248-886(-)
MTGDVTGAGFSRGQAPLDSSKNGNPFPSSQGRRAFKAVGPSRRARGQPQEARHGRDALAVERHRVAEAVRILRGARAHELANACCHDRRVDAVLRADDVQGLGREPAPGCMIRPPSAFEPRHEGVERLRPGGAYKYRELWLEAEIFQGCLGQHSRNQNGALRISEDGVEWTLIFPNLLNGLEGVIDSNVFLGFEASNVRRKFPPGEFIRISY